MLIWVDGIHHDVTPVPPCKGTLDGLFTRAPRVRQDLRHVGHHLGAKITLPDIAGLLRHPTNGVAEVLIQGVHEGPRQA